MTGCRTAREWMWPLWLNGSSRVFVGLHVGAVMFRTGLQACGTVCFHQGPKVDVIVEVPRDYKTRLLLSIKSCWMMPVLGSQRTLHAAWTQSHYNPTQGNIFEGPISICSADASTSLPLVTVALTNLGIGQVFELPCGWDD